MRSFLIISEESCDNCGILNVAGEYPEEIIERFKDVFMEQTNGAFWLEEHEPILCGSLDEAMATGIDLAAMAYAEENAEPEIEAEA